jgi:cell wall-associated NlpC family hydrolase
MTQMEHERQAVVNEAMEWNGTPFHHGQKLKGVGVDCALLLAAVYSSVGLIEVPKVERYAANWFMHEKRERLEEVLQRYCQPTDTPQTGDIVTFRYGRSNSHAGIIVGEWMIIHADRIAGRVTLDMYAPNYGLAARIAGFWTLKSWAASNG